MINKSTFDTIHAGNFVLHSYLLNDINGCKGTIYIRIHCLLHYIIIMRFLCPSVEGRMSFSRGTHVLRSEDACPSVGGRTLFRRNETTFTAF